MTPGSDALEEGELVYIAKRLPEATRLEAILTAAGVDYSVAAEEYQGGVVFRRTRTGAFFYVPAEAREAAFAAMRAGGYKPFAPH